VLRVLLAALILIAGASLARAQTEERVALVIGNSAYQDVAPLENPKNDATDLATALERIGFSVTLAIDLDNQGMRGALREFRDKANGADMAIVYFAGHGVEIAKQNYLIPVDAHLETDSDVLFDTIPIDLINEAVSGAKTLRMVLLDACRNNPFLGKIRVAEDTGRSLGRGLGAFEPIGGTLVAFASKGGTIALDGAGRNSPFMEGLLAHIEEPGLDIMLMMRKVRDTVLEETGNRQEPFVYGSLPGREIYLVEPTEQAAVVQPPAGSAAPALSNPAQEDFAWSLVKDSADPEQIKSFIRNFPGGAHFDEALARLQTLSQTPDVQVADLPEAPEIPEPIDPRALIIAIQRELDVAGCKPGTADGQWGNQSRKALQTFSDAAGLGLTTMEPTEDVLNVLKSRGTVVCVAAEPDTQVALAEPTAPEAAGDLSACVMVEVKASELDPNGEVWDWAINGDPEPDILIAETTTGTRIRCDDSFSCLIRINPESDTLSFSIVDYDRVSPNQLMGEGQCKLGQSCELGNASLTMSGC
jgi:hypothetical protein